MDAYFTETGQSTPFRILEADRVATYLDNRHIMPPEEFKWANSFFNPLGAECAKGWLLMARGVLLRMDMERQYDLYFDDSQSSGPGVMPSDKVKFPGIVIIRALNLLPGQPQDPNAPYLLEVADARWLVHNPTYCMGLYSQYNVRTAAYDLKNQGDGNFYTSSINVGSAAAWTWITLLQDIWSNFLDGKLNPAGSSFTFNIPHPPNGTPENFEFLGVSAWLAFHSILDRINDAISFDYLAAKDTPAPPYPSSLYVAVTLGEGSVTRQTTELLQTLIDADRMIHDDEPLESTRCRLPKGVDVFHHRVYEHGAERIDLNSAVAWPIFSHYRKRIDISGSGEADVYHPLWDDLPCLMNTDDTIANQTALDSRDQERADQYLARLTDGGTLLHQRFAGIWPLSTDGKIRGVSWRQLPRGPQAGGWITEVVRHSRKNVRAVAGQWEAVPCAEETHFGQSDSLRPPDFRPSYPIWPPHAQVIEVDPDGIFSGGIISGKFKRWHSDDNTWVDAGGCYGVQLPSNCWIGRIVGTAAAEDGSVLPAVAFEWITQFTISTTPKTVTVHGNYAVVT